MDRSVTYDFLSVISSKIWACLETIPWLTAILVEKMQSLPYAYALFEGLAVGIFVKNFGLKN